MLKEFLKNKLLRLAIGVIGFLGGAILQVLDWGTGEGSSAGGDFFYIALIITAIGGYFLVDLKLKDRNTSGEYAILFPLVVLGALSGYDIYITNRIEMEGKTTTAVIIQVYEKRSAELSTRRGVWYKYTVKGKTFLKSDYSGTLEIGDSIKIKYYEENPNFHFNGIEK